MTTLTPENPNIQDILNYTNVEYLDLKMEKYLNWCNSFAIDNKTYQQVIANRAMANFFNKLWHNCEQDFIETFEQYPNLNTKDYHEAFGRCLVQLHNRYPKGIIQEAKKIKIINLLILTS